MDWGENVSWRDDLLLTDEWSSDYDSVNSLLRYLSRERSGSKETRNLYLSVLARFLKRFDDMNPDELLELDREELERKIQEFLDDFSHSKTANLYKEALKTFFRVNDRENLDFPSYYQPPRGGRKRPEYVPKLEEAWKMAECAGSLKARALVTLFFTTGLRNSTARALKFGEGSPNPMLEKYTIKDELDRGEENLMITVYPEMKKEVPDACKRKIPYYVFTPKKATEILRDYLDERKRQNEKIEEGEFLFPSDYKALSKKERVNNPISMGGILKTVKTAARRAGLEEWKHVTPQSLRKVFERVLRTQPSKSCLDRKEQEYFMGHIVGNSVQDAYFDQSKVKEFRKKFSKLNFDPQVQSKRERFLKEKANYNEIDYSEVKSEVMEDKKGELDLDEVKEELKRRIEEKEKDAQKVIDEDEVQEYLNRGWDFVDSLNSGKAVVSIPKAQIEKNSDKSQKNSWKKQSSEKERGNGNEIGKDEGKESENEPDETGKNHSVSDRTDEMNAISKTEKPQEQVSLLDF